MSRIKYEWFSAWMWARLQSGRWKKKFNTNGILKWFWHHFVLCFASHRKNTLFLWKWGVSRWVLASFCWNQVNLLDDYYYYIRYACCMYLQFRLTCFDRKQNRNIGFIVFAFSKVCIKLFMLLKKLCKNDAR